MGLVRSSRLVPVLGWCAATLTSVALASVAMLPVLRTATPDGSALVSVDQLRDSGEVEPSPLPPASIAAPGPEPEPSATTSRSRRAEPGDTPSRTSATPTAPRSTSPAESTTSTEDGWTVTTDGDGVKSYVRSFRVEGGQTVMTRLVIYDHLKDRSKTIMQFSGFVPRELPDKLFNPARSGDQ